MKTFLTIFLMLMATSVFANNQECRSSEYPGISVVPPECQVVYTEEVLNAKKAEILRQILEIEKQVTELERRNDEMTYRQIIGAIIVGLSIWVILTIIEQTAKITSRLLRSRKK